MTLPTKTMFAANVNTPFKLTYAPDQTLEVELIEYREGRSNPRQEMFSITFRGPREVWLPQAMYPFAHDALGQFDLFIVPVGQDEQGIYYEAVFNHLLTPGG